MSMAQTRASAKACRIAYAHIVVLAGYEPTPAEEMGATGSEVPIETHEDPPQRAKPAQRAPRVKKPEAEDVESEDGLTPVGKRDDKGRLICQGTVLGESDAGPDYGARTGEPVDVGEQIIVVWRDGKRWPVVVDSIESETDGRMIVRTKARSR